MEVLLGVFSAFGLSASAGLNAYIPLLVVAVMARFSNLIQLNPPWDTLTSGWIIGLLLVLSLVEFFADKVPAVNHLNDAIQTFIRPAAGAVAFAASAEVITDIHPVISLAAGLLIAGSVHAVKSAAVRPAITATTGGAANVPISIAEDIFATILSILAVVTPVILTVVIILLMAFVLYLIWQRTTRDQEYRTR